MNDEILDLNEFLKRIQNDKALLWELLDIFVRDFQEKRRQMQEAFRHNDCEQIRRLSHALRGSCGNISAHLLYKIVTKLEQMGSRNDLTGADKLLEDVDKKFEDLLARIRALKEELT